MAIHSQAETRLTEIKRESTDLQREQREMEMTIAGVLRLAPESVVNGYTAPIQPIAAPTRKIRPATPDSQKYALLSTRLAILLALSEGKGPMIIPELAAELKAGGVHTEAANFNNNVSAVLTRMKSDRGEVDLVDGKWVITEIGRSAITYIKAQKLRRRISHKAEAPDVVVAPGDPKRKGEGS